MSELQARISRDFAEARKSGDATRATFLSVITSSLTNEEIAQNRQPLTDDQVISFLTTQRKSLIESRELYARGGREDLVAQADIEVSWLAGYLPTQLSADELEAQVRDIIAGIPNPDAKAFGMIMGQLNKKFPHRIDGNLASSIIRTLLG